MTTRGEKERILIEVEKYDDVVSCEIHSSDYTIECYEFESLKDFKENILELVIDVTSNKKLTKDNLKIKYLNKTK